MRHLHCPDCGMPLSSRPLGDEGLVPWCDGCHRPWFDSFSTCIIVAVMNDEGQVLLQRESRRPDREVLVAGYIKPGESAEETVRREVAEETALTVTSLQYLGSWPHMNGDMLMLGYLAPAEGNAMPASSEVLSARWAAPDEAIASLREGSIAQQVVKLIRTRQAE